MIIALVKQLDAGVNFSAACMARVSTDASAIFARLRDTSRGRRASDWWCSRCVARGVREHAREEACSKIVYGYLRIDLLIDL